MTQPPPWWRAWQKIVPRLVASGQQQQLDPGLAAIYQRFEAQGLDCRHLVEWLPTREQSEALLKLQTIRTQLLDPLAKKPERRQHQAAQLVARHQLPKLLLQALEANVAGRLQLRRTATPSVAAQGCSPATPAAAANQRPAKPAKSTRARTKNERQRAQARLERVQLAVPSATTWARDAGALTISIDEAWPAEGARRQEGVIAGIVWDGAAPDPQELPFIRDHLGPTLKAYEALGRLFQCRRALPFIFPITLDEQWGTAQRHYDELVQAAIQLVLGWVLPAGGNLARVRIQLDHDSRHPHGSQQTDFYRGLLASGPRFARWQLDEVVWYDIAQTTDNYIGYADALAYLALEHTDQNQELGRIARFKKLPGYIPLSLELLPRLQRLEHLEETGHVDDLLDLAVELHGTKIHSLILSDVRRRLAARPDLQLRVLESLDQRQLANGRDAEQLRQQLEAVRLLIPEAPRQASHRGRLPDNSVAVQNANHNGDSPAVERLIAAFTRLRDQAIHEEAELVVHCNLHLAASLADRFEFQRAWELIDPLVRSDRFGVLPRILQGKLLSALGQYHSLLGRRDEAEESFQRALVKFASAAIAPAAAATERSQTSVYRALNALDGRLPGSLERVHEVLGPLDGAADRFARGSSGQLNEFHHHLLVRTLALGKDRGLTRQPAERYLAQRDSWAMHLQHPWPLIAMYRGLLLWQVADDATAAADWFGRGIQAATRPPCGASLQLVGAMIATAGHCCLGDPALGDAAERWLAAAQQQLPGAGRAVAQLRDVLAEPRAARIGEMFAALPLYYH